MGGRWPANLVLSHSVFCERVGERRVKDAVRTANDQVVGKGYHGFRPDGEKKIRHADESGMETVEAWDCHESCPVKALDGQSGTSKTTVRITTDRDDIRGGNLINNHRKRVEGAPQMRDYGGEGGASRFFPTFSYTEDDLITHSIGA